LPIRDHDGNAQAERELAEFFDAAPPHLSEILQTEAFRIVDMLRARAKILLKPSNNGAGDDIRPVPESREDIDVGDSATSPVGGRTIVAVVLEADRSIKEVLRLNDIQTRDAKRLQALFANHRVVLDARLGGLAASGLLDAREGDLPSTLDGERVATIVEEGGKRLWSDERLKKSGLGFRVRVATHDENQEDGWNVAYRRALKPESDDADEAAALQEWRVEEWVGDGPADNDSSLTKTTQELARHHERIADWAHLIAEGLRLPEMLRDMLVTAARLHDSGKARAIWQRFAGNPRFALDPKNNPPRAKFTTRGDPRLLKIGDGTYRHEFGSVLDAIDARAFDHLPSLRALGLHLIAAHHGYARPTIFAYDEKHPDGEKSQEVAGQLVRGFAALQMQWGSWGLAWLEALLRAADVAASREDSSAEARG
jgi:CRISPR-associated endonuclease/helicase Cas3